MSVQLRCVIPAEAGIQASFWIPIVIGVACVEMVTFFAVSGQMLVQDGVEFISQFLETGILGMEFVCPLIPLLQSAPQIHMEHPPRIFRFEALQHRVHRVNENLDDGVSCS